jgi:hypothetical protein
MAMKALAIQFKILHTLRFLLNYSLQRERDECAHPAVTPDISSVENLDRKMQEGINCLMKIGFLKQYTFGGRPRMILKVVCQEDSRKSTGN